MRMAPVLIGDTEYSIGRLSCGQVDEIIFAKFEIQQERTQIVAVVQGTKRAVRDRICPAIAAALNNAREGDAKWYLSSWANPRPEAEGKWWTPEDVFSDLEYGEMVKVYDAVAALSGLMVKVEKGPSKPGEDQAADTPAAS